MIVRTGARVSVRAVEACGLFGLMVESERGASQSRGLQPARFNADPLLETKPGQVVLLTGPSGSGKSRALRKLQETLVKQGEIVVRPTPIEPHDRRAVIDLIPGPIDRAMGLLARAGLSEARLLARRPAELSEGERFRLGLALAMHRALANDGAWLLCDEFCSVLDRATAQSVALSIACWVRRVGRKGGLRFVGAAAHEDMPRLFGADRVVRFDTASDAPRLKWQVRARKPRVRIEDGTTHDYDALGMYHYRAGRPATRVLVRRAIRRLPDGSDRIAGVMVVSMPTLNGVWRKYAWPGRYDGPEKQAQTRRLNRELRCISRVVVEPGSRGLGIAVRLVRDYLGNPLTPATEAIAQMGSACPFFARAGMVEYALPMRTVDARLIDAMAAYETQSVECVAEADDLACDPFINRELRRWVRNTRSVRSRNPPIDWRLLRRALMMACASPRAYASVTRPVLRTDS